MYAFHRYMNPVRRLLNLNSTASIITGASCRVPQKLTLYDAVRYQFLRTTFTSPPPDGKHPSHILSFEMCRI